MFVDETVNYELIYKTLLLKKPTYVDMWHKFHLL